jgi:hypothetical protein
MNKLTIIYVREDPFGRNKLFPWLLVLQLPITNIDLTALPLYLTNKSIDLKDSNSLTSLLFSSILTGTHG